MRNKTFIITLAAVLLVSICMAPRSNAFVGVAALTTIIAATFTSAALLNEAEKNHKAANEKKHSKAAVESRGPVKGEPVNMETANPVGK
jgi:hydroxylamine reductase (hybrid-cluster protein)